MTKDAFWFTHDASARNDPKILAMRSAYGAEGYGWYWMIVEMLREQRDYRYPINKYTSNALAMQLQCDADAVHQFVSDCIKEFGLFQSDGSYFWSESLIRRLRKWEEKRESRSERARRAAHVRWGKAKSDADGMREQCDSNADAMQSDAIEYNRIEEDKTYIDSRDKEMATSSESKKVVVPYQQIVDLYHSLVPSLPKVMRLTDKRRAAIRARWNEYDGDLETFRKLFEMTEASDFLSGRNGSWNGCNFDWLMKPSNMIKVLEGNYNRQSQRPKTTQTLDIEPPSWVDMELERLDQEADKS